jgi:microcystin-dependent protein
MSQDLIFYQPPQIGTFIDSLIELPSTHFCLCDGSTYQAADYPELFALLPGSLKTATDFTLPDMAGVSRVGVGTLITTVFNFLEAGGDMTHTLSSGEMPVHTHGESIAIPAIINGGLEAPASAATASTGTTGPAGSGQPHNNMPPYLPVKVYVCARLP